MNFSKVTGQKCNIRKHVAFLYINEELVERKIRGEVGNGGKKWRDKPRNTNRGQIGTMVGGIECGSGGGQGSGKQWGEHETIVTGQQ